MSTPDETVTISKAAYDLLLERDAFLSALEAAGVDNWEAYDEARRSLATDDDDDE